MKHIISTFVIVLFIFISMPTTCQVSMKMDTKIKNLIYKRAAQNKITIGYRIHLTFNDDIKILQDHQVQIIRRFPGIDTYIEFKTPSFYLEVGNFRTKHEAKLVHDKLRRQFPMSTISKQKIEMPRID